MREREHAKYDKADAFDEINKREYFAARVCDYFVWLVLSACLIFCWSEALPAVVVAHE